MMPLHECDDGERMNVVKMVNVNFMPIITKDLTFVLNVPKEPLNVTPPQHHAQNTITGNVTLTRSIPTTLLVSVMSTSLRWIGFEDPRQDLGLICAGTADFLFPMGDHPPRSECRILGSEKKEKKRGFYSFHRR